MRFALVLCRRLNHRNIELDDDTRGERVGVYRRNGELTFVPWLGFIDRASAKAVRGARPVKLEVARIGVRTARGTDWETLPPGATVQGCLIGRGVYAIVDATVAVLDSGPPRRALTIAR